MPALTPKFITGANSHNGLPGYLQHLFRAFGTTAVLSGQTSIAVPFASIKAGDLVYVTARTAGANAVSVVSTTIVAGTGFTINVDTDPGAGGASYNYFVVRAS